MRFGLGVIKLERFNFFGLTLFGVIFVWIANTAQSSSYFKWTDSKGVVHFSDSPDNVPSEYRPKTESNEFEEVTKQQEKSGKVQPIPPNRPQGQVKVPEKVYKIPFVGLEGSARRIIISVTFNDSVTVPMILDTGAPGLLISYRLADRLGLNKKNGGKLLIWTGGIGGSTPAVRTIIDSVQVSGIRDTFVPTKVTKAFSNSFEGLIGMDFIANYSINIDYQKKLLTFKEVRQTGSLPGGHNEIWWSDNFKEFSHYRRVWREYRVDIDKKIRASNIVVGGERDRLDKIKAFVGYQVQESEKLFSKLDSYASRNSVPTTWRRY